MKMRALTEADLSRAAEIHAESFETSWDAAALGAFLSPTAICLGVEGAGTLQGFILLGPCTDQTDIITLAVSPDMRGKGLGGRLTQAAQEAARTRGVELIFLEVAQDNHAAIALYKSLGYVPIGRRKNYYKRVGGRVDALTFRKDLS
jgi:ribosomal-protein-alanine N-acetyltransferase